MKKIDIEKLAGNQPADYDAEPQIPYEDIELLAEKINEVIDLLNGK